MDAHRRLRALVLVALPVLVVAGVLVGIDLGSGGSSDQNARALARAPLSGILRAPGGANLVDRYGRVVYLHGVNAVYKRPPFELFADAGKPWNFTGTDATRIANVGFNVVRLGVIWQGIEPGTLGSNDPRICTPGIPTDPQQFDPAVARAYLDRVAQTVATLGRHHVYTLLDMHEDVYSTGFGGEGAPAWAVCTNGAPIATLPGRWSNTYAAAGLDAAVRHFWTNDVRGDLEGEYERSWQAVAERFRGNPWVVGFDPINEPFTRTVKVTDPFRTKAEDSDPQVAQNLECLYTGSAHPGYSEVDGALNRCPPQVPKTGLIPVLQKADPSHPVFFEPDIFTSRGRPNDIGPMNLPNLVFNFHDYCGYRSPVTGDPTNIGACSLQEIRTMARRTQERPGIASGAQRGGPALFMSEFGATSSEDLMANLTADADHYRVGWIYWAWKYYADPTGSSNEALVLPTGRYAATVSALARTYPEAVAGTPRSFSFDPATAVFHLRYAASPVVKAPTLIFVPVSVHYPHGYCATAAGASVVSKPDATNLVIRNDPGAADVTVTVQRGRCGS